MKTAAIRPLLKKEQPGPKCNYRPISNLTFLSKIIQKVVHQQMNSYLTDNNIHDKFKSGFRTAHSTETTLLKVVNNMRINSDNKKASVLILLSWDPAGKAKNCVGLFGAVLQCFKSYLHNWHFIVTLGDFHSNSHKLVCGVQQGSILGPLLFNLYMLPLGHIISKYNISYHNYANNTQLLISLSTDDVQPINALVSCVEEINGRMAANFLQLQQGEN